MRFQIPYAITYVVHENARPEIGLLASSQRSNTPLWYRASCVLLHRSGRDFSCMKSRNYRTDHPLDTELGCRIALIVPSVRVVEERGTLKRLLRFPTDDDWWVFQTYCAERDLLNAW